MTVGLCIPGSRILFMSVVFHPDFKYVIHVQHFRFAVDPSFEEGDELGFGHEIGGEIESCASLDQFRVKRQREQP